MGLPSTGQGIDTDTDRLSPAWSVLILMTQSYFFTNFVRNSSRYFVLRKDRTGLSLLLDDIFLVCKSKLLGVECVLCSAYHVLCYNSPQLRPPNHKQVAG